MTKIFSSISIAILALVLIQAQAAPFDNVVVTDVRKEVDLYTQLAYQDSFVTFRNDGSKPLNQVHFAVESEYIDRIALITVEDPSNNGEYKYARADQPDVFANNNATLFIITLRDPLNAGRSVNIKISITFYNRQDPLPKKITTLEDQFVVLEDNTLFFSPYKVLTQRTEYKLAGLPKSQTGGGKVKGSRVEYSATAETEPFSRNVAAIHYENNYPFVTFTEAVKTIEVSHWGNIFITEEFKLENQGAALKGEYSRVDFNAHRGTGKNALKSLSAKLPVHTWGLHYRDEIGNISTSNAYRHADHVSLTIRPRYAVFGGWKAWWDLSYNLPTKYYLYQEQSDSTKFVLKQKFGFPFESIMAENFTLKVVLPEGAKDIEVSLPFEIESQTEGKSFGMLDFEGRKTIVIQKRNVLNYHHKEFRVSYTYDNSSVLKKPLLLFAAFFTLFILLIAAGRLDFTFPNKTNVVKAKSL